MVLALLLMAAALHPGMGARADEPKPAPSPQAQDNPGSPQGAPSAPAAAESKSDPAAQEGKPGRSVFGTIVGAIYDTKKKPLTGWMVQLSTRGQGGLLRVTGTNEKGQYVFKDLPAGTYDIEIGTGDETARKKGRIEVRPPFRNFVDFEVGPHQDDTTNTLAGLVASKKAAEAGDAGPARGAPAPGVPFRGTFADAEKRPVSDVPVYHADVRVWRVTNAAGKHVGLWYFDPYTRTAKRSGAWMNAYRHQERFEGDVATIVSNNSNFVKGRPGEPVLISWEDARTLFHEFGHALHGLSSSVSYPSLAGTLVARDYVEFPSQLLEHWLETPEVLNRFALHHQTGQPISAALVEKIKRASTFNQGFSTVEYLASALVDMKLHLAGDRAIDPDAFERDTLKAIGMPDEVVMRHRTPHFSHVFSSDSYSAGYYSYLWSDTLSADAFEAFTEAGGPYDKTVAQRLREHVFSVGNTIDPGEGYRGFRGRDARIAALMRKRGFPAPDPAASTKP